MSDYFPAPKTKTNSADAAQPKAAKPPLPKRRAAAGTRHKSSSPQAAGKAPASIVETAGVETARASLAGQLCETEQETQRSCELPAATSSARLAVAPDEVNLGEFVIGSHETHKLPLMWNLTDERAEVYFTVAGESFELVENPGAILFPSAKMRPEELAQHIASGPVVAFHPKTPGSHQAQLVAAVTWAHGTSETVIIPLAAQARFLSTAPEEAASEHVAKEPVAGLEVIKGYDARFESNFASSEASSASARALAFARRIADEQVSGLSMVSDEAAAYEKNAEVINRSDWWVLAEVVLSLASAAVIAQIVKEIGPIVSTAFSGAAAKGLTPASGLAFQPSATYGMVTHAIEKGVTRAAQKGIVALTSGAGHKHADPSSNTRIQFFSSLESALRANASEYDQSVLQLQREMAPRSTADAIVFADLMWGISNVLEECSLEAKAMQAAITTPQWLATVARSSLGSVAPESQGSGVRGQEGLAVTDLSSARAVSEIGSGALSAHEGLLDITVQSALNPRVAMAHVTGVSQEIADRLSGLALLTVPMPLRVIVGANSAEPAVITRDEAQNLRVEGNVRAIAAASSGAGAGDSEAEAVRGAEIILEKCLSRSLMEQNVGITTDDATGRRS